MRTFLFCVLVSAMLPLSASAQRVTGTATKLDRMALPPSAVFEAKVEDVSRADAPSTTVGAVRVEGPGQVPISFAIDVDPQRVDAAHAYAVRATVVVDGKLRYTTDTVYPVLTRGAGTHVEVVLKPVPTSQPGSPASRPGGTAGAVTPGGPGEAGRPASATTPSPLDGTSWKLVELGGEPVALPEAARRPASLTFGDGGRASLTGGCNQMMTGYTLDGEKLSFGKVAGTLMACPPGLDVDTAFSDALSRVAGWRKDGSRLELRDSQGQVVARFEASAPRDKTPRPQ